MIDNLESKINSSFFRRTARNIGLYVGAIALALTAGCTAQKNISKENHPHPDNYYDLDKPTTADVFKKEPEKPKGKRLPPFEIGISLGKGNSYSSLGAKLSGILNIDRQISCELGLSYGLIAAPIANNAIVGTFVLNGSATAHYKIMEEQSLFLRLFYGTQGANVITDCYGNVVTFKPDILGGGIMLGSRFTSSDGTFAELGLGIMMCKHAPGYHADYGFSGAFDLGIGFKFG